MAAPTTKAAWAEFSDSYVKLRFVCPVCGRETERIPLCEVLRTGAPICKHCAFLGPMTHNGTYVFV